MAALDAGLPDVVSVWLDGRSTSGLVLWGHTMLWWGRLGKIVQFAAGLVAVFDLIGLDRLVRWLGRQERRYERIRRKGRIEARVQRYARMRQELYDGFFFTVTSGGRPAVKPVTGIHRKPPAHAPEGVDHAQLVSFWTEVIAELPGAHGCRHDHPEPCREQHDHVLGRIDDFLGRLLPKRERTLLGRAGRAAEQTVAIQVVSLLAATAALLWLAVSIQSSASAFRLVALGVVAALGLLLAVTPGDTRSAVRWWVHRSVLRPVVFGIDRTRPFHLLRWLAFAMFAVGFLFDLLAS
ncbi:hypothetical protein [Microbispora sp. NPDC049633]|uniref:hypothetical protein n=1 Tax=Microbispora sp. NPDC049633 TaxID=3154355 RepID=UPI00341A14D6